MFQTTAAYRQAIAGFAVQHLTGTLTLASGTVIVLDDNTLGGTPKYEKRCTEDEDVFMFGQLYTGTLELELLSATVSEYELVGAEVSLIFSVDGAEDEIPLGVWTVSQPERRNANSVRLRCVDCVSKLDVPITDNTVGMIDIESNMHMVTELTGVEFAQTPAEIIEMADGEAWTTTFAATCRQAVAELAQFIGGFACADRYGRIMFGRFGDEPVLTVQADMRHSASLSEYTYAVSGVGYADKYGHTTVLTWPVQAQIKDNIIISDNGYIWDRYVDGEQGTGEYDLEYATSGTHKLPEADQQYCYPLSRIAAELSKDRVWTPGEIQYYGDPALDLGDMIELTDGIAGTSANFLITADYWQFRGAQTLLSAGTGQSSGDSSAGGNTFSAGTGGAGKTTTIDAAGSMVILTAEEAEQSMPGGMTQLCERSFSCRRQTAVTVYLTAILSGSSTAELHVLYDAVMQTILAKESLSGSRTVQLVLPLTVMQGRHTVTAEVCDCDVERIEMSIVGQGITGEVSDVTFTDEYTYRERNATAEILSYTGHAEALRIPARLGGLPVSMIGADSFSHNTTIKNAKIPEGVEKIK